MVFESECCKFSGLGHRAQAVVIASQIGRVFSDNAALLRCPTLSPKAEGSEPSELMSTKDAKSSAYKISQRTASSKEELRNTVAYLH